MLFFCLHWSDVESDGVSLSQRASGPRIYFTPWQIPGTTDSCLHSSSLSHDSRLRCGIADLYYVLYGRTRPTCLAIPEVSIACRPHRNTYAFNLVSSTLLSFYTALGHGRPSSLMHSRVACLNLWVNVSWFVAPYLCSCVIKVVNVDELHQSGLSQLKLFLVVCEFPDVAIMYNLTCCDFAEIMFNKTLNPKSLSYV